MWIEDQRDAVVGDCEAAEGGQTIALRVVAVALRLGSGVRVSLGPAPESVAVTCCMSHAEAARYPLGAEVRLTLVAERQSP